MNTEMMEALHALAAERGISVDALFAARADALESAYKRIPGAKEYAWVTIDPETMELREIALPHAGARPRRLEITSDDKIWYVDYARGFLGRYDPASGEFQEWASPGGTRARAYGMALDDQDRVWFVESGLDPNQFVGFDTHSLEFFSVTAISSGAGTVRHMYFHKPTRTIWFGTDANTIGRARVP